MFGYEAVVHVGAVVGGPQELLKVESFQGTAAGLLELRDHALLIRKGKSSGNATTWLLVSDVRPDVDESSMVVVTLINGSSVIFRCDEVVEYGICSTT